MKKMIGKIFCSLGYHSWTCKIQDYIDEFGFVPLDSRVPKVSKCSRCNKNYEDGK